MSVNPQNKNAVPILHAPGPNDPIIDNGSLVQLGINATGELNVRGGTSPTSCPTSSVGLRYIPTNNDAASPGCPCEGWGVANADSTTGTFSAWANQSEGGAFNLTVQAGTGITNPTGQILADSVGSAFKSIVQDTSDRVRVTHNFFPSITPNLYQINVTITNIGTTIGDLRYRRVIDWDVAPFCFDEWVRIHVGSGPNLLVATTDGFESANPLSSPGPDFTGSPPTSLFPGSPDYFGGPTDQGVLFDLTFGTLAPGASKSFTMFYGASQSVSEALDAINIVDAQMYSLGIPRLPNSTDPDLLGPNTYILAFSFASECDLIITDPDCRISFGLDAPNGPNNPIPDNVCHDICIEEVRFISGQNATACISFPGVSSCRLGGVQLPTLTANTNADIFVICAEEDISPDCTSIIVKIGLLLVVTTSTGVPIPFITSITLTFPGTSFLPYPDCTTGPLNAVQFQEALEIIDGSCTVIQLNATTNATGTQINIVGKVIEKLWKHENLWVVGLRPYDLSPNDVAINGFVSFTISQPLQPINSCTSFPCLL
jgi:hypothetical protein